MKKTQTILLAAALLSGAAASAQSISGNADVAASRQRMSTIDKPSGSDTAAFYAEGLPSLTFSQAHYTDSWKDGKNSLGFRAAFLGTTTYTKGRIFFKNTLDAAYAKSKEGAATEYTKKEDRLNLNSSLGYEVTPNLPLYWAAQVDLKTQFDEGVNANNEIISDFFAPAFVMASLGIRYQSNFGLSAVLSPITGRFTIVSDTFFCKYVDTDLAAKPRHLRAQLGAYGQVMYDKNLNKYVGIKSSLELFTPYQKGDFGNIDVDWTTSANFNVNSWLAIIFFNRVVYRDKDRYQVKVTDADGNVTMETRGPKVQWMESLNIGITYKFVTK